jgi:hypothetical protein
VKEFVSGQVVPFVGVVFAIAALTLALFDVPSRAPEPVLGLRVPASAQPALRTASERAHIDDTLTQVLRTLDEGRRPPPPRSATPLVASAPQPAGPANVAERALAIAQQPTSPSPSPAPDPKLLSAVSALSDAVRAIHDARTEEDLVHAEEMVRSARTQMEASCASASGPLCASADQIRALGY